MCNCIDLIDAKLKETDTNTKLDIPIVFSTSGGLSAKGVLIATVKWDKTNRKKPSLLFAAYCPFCGQPYKKGDAPPPQPTADDVLELYNLGFDVEEAFEGITRENTSADSWSIRQELLQAWQPLARKIKALRSEFLLPAQGAEEVGDTDAEGSGL